MATVLVVIKVSLKELDAYRGTSPHINRPPPQDPPRTLDIGLR
jgi:hypothetical protein